MSEKQNKSSKTKRKSVKTKKKTVVAKNKEANKANVVDDIKNIITEYDIYLFREGKHFSLYEKLGAHVIEHNNTRGTFFAVWAPNAESVSVIGNFNGWQKEANILSRREDDSGLWEGFIPNVEKGEAYKYFIRSMFDGFEVEKADPVGFYSEQPPKTASVVWEYNYNWNDAAWMKKRGKNNALDSPYSVYEVHLESWRRKPEEDMKPLSYAELAEQLTAYVKDMGYTHVELMPVTEFPFSGSWGYQVTGFFAPTSRFGTPDDFMYFVDYLHQNDIGVIMDWVPSHFPGDQHGLHFFDGTYLYEHEDPRKGYHPDWSSYIFNYGRNEIRNFLISSAHSWMERFHIDGIRVDAVASMLYLDYSRKEGEWIPNEHGGRENLDAIKFLRDLNESIYTKFPDVQTIAEESTAWPMVTRPVYTGGLGFGMKWNMGWMHDTLGYFQNETVHRSYHHNQMTFSIMYAFNENFMLSLSHDEVVHGKGSLINKMPGDDWQKFANLRAMFGFMFAHPGKKLHFMGMEFGQWKEWNHESSLDWHLLEHDTHKGLQFFIKDLNSVYKRFPALYENDFSGEGFKWIDANDSQNSVFSFVRYDKQKKHPVLIVANLTPVPRYNYRVGVPDDAKWQEILNSDAKQYGGSGMGNFGGVDSNPVPYHDEEQSINIMIPPLGIVMFAKE
ncbi:1,4-alpha-glucan branching protein GlgB [Draconibacterium halophilum]|uniref:1,4-alpha-glucan branching enzyme GlgB n=1 Tax=Draconibacterium halophilum TaxID=2706887 RepID=A0A6C0RGF5_9BACT|nr:1,4-alpha-glucan branching protein GlgB [Draconibacterium halophilum]QIA09076.1 1,4-alpha-glucan branching protein GlgB [Draconibacterium halophilum]